jgi:hypothetical protein
VHCEVIVKKDTASLSLDNDAKLGDLMKKLSTEHGIEIPKRLGQRSVSIWQSCYGLPRIGAVCGPTVCMLCVLDTSFLRKD